MSVTRHRDGVGVSRATARDSGTEDDGGTGRGRSVGADASGPGTAAEDIGVRTYRYAVAGWGVGELAVRNGALLAHTLPSPRRGLGAQRGASPPGGPPEGGAGTPDVTLSPEPSQECDVFVPDLCRRFAAHLNGMRVGYDDVPVGEDGLTPFQRELLRAARSVSWGEVVTYGGLAALAGRPRAARAAGSFCAQSRLALVVPCHRIVAAGKDEPFGIGGYGRSGLRLKRRLLALEGTLL